MTVRPPHARVCRRERGLAMIETVLTLPFIFVLLALIMYCGVTMLRWHRVSSVDRYETWRAVASAPGPSAPAAGGSSAFDATPLGEAFFPVTSTNGQSSSVRDPYGLDQLAVAVRRGLETEGNQDPAFTYLSNAIRANGDGPTQELFDAIFITTSRPLPAIRVVEVTGEFEGRFGQSFAGEFAHAVSRIDGDWRYVNDALDMELETFYDRVSDRIDVPLYNDDAEEERPRRIVSLSTGVWDDAFGNFRNVVSPLAVTNPLAAELRAVAIRVPAYAGPKLPVRAVREPNLDWDFQWAPAGE
ncbi:MAG: hypothetical protein AAGH92_12670 [Planctomycetota bacterium]